MDSGLFEVVERVVADAGLELVDVRLSGAGSRRILRVDIDRAGPRGVGIEDCKRVSQALGLALDEDDSIPGRFVLEVSSPGADRPIRSADDIRRNTGRRVTVTASGPDGGQSSFHGCLLGSDGGYLVLSGDRDEQPIRIPLDDVITARPELEW